MEEIEDGDPFVAATENAVRKARAVAGDLVLGADTVVALEDQILGQPADEGRAYEFVRALAGRTHEVHSGLALVRDSDIAEAAAVTEVTFRSFGAELAEWYVRSGEWRGRAGGYAIQGRGAALVERIDGDYLNVVGLPVAALLRVWPGLLSLAS